MEEKGDFILKVEGLSVSFATTAGRVHALRNVDFAVRRGETVAIVGESGSGKSVTVKTAIGILDTNGKVEAGKALFTFKNDKGEEETIDLLKLTKKQMRQTINGKRIAMVFQDPMTSLNPTMTIGDQIMEGMIWHFKTPKKEAWKRAVELLDMVGITDPEKRMKNYPHQLSGGMRQRVVIAIALSCNPDLLICDEPTTALDVTIQAKILELIKEVQQKLGISVIYITHDLGVVAKVADFVNIMYAGKIGEKGRVDEVYYDPRHPYTWGLLSALPDLETHEKDSIQSPEARPTFFTKSKATHLHRVMNSHLKSTKSKSRPCSGFPTPTVQQPGFLMTTLRKSKCRRNCA